MTGPTAFVRLPRDPRLDLFRGLANWAIFLDHVPHEVLSWATLKHYGFSDAADTFVFIAGYTAAAAFGRLVLEEGYGAAFARALKRAFRIYSAHILTLLLFVSLVALVAHGLNDIDDLHQYNVDVFTDAPVTGAFQMLIMQYKPVNLDVLPLYVLLIGAFAPGIFLLGRCPNLTLALSFLIYCAARHWHLNVPAYPRGEWYFNPLTWQFLFVIGAWSAIVGRRTLGAVIGSNRVLIVALAYLAFALLLSLPVTRDYLPSALTAWFAPNDKTNLAPYRIVHLLALALLAIRMIPAGASPLGWRIAEPAILCGKHSLPVFCTGVLVAFLAHVTIELGGNVIAAQLLAGSGGLGAMCVVAYWSAGRLQIPTIRFQGASFDGNRRR
jgi:hypothetical protein